MFLSDEEYKEAETWLNQSTNEYTRLSIVVNDYLKKKARQEKGNEGKYAASNEEITSNQPIGQPASDPVITTGSPSSEADTATDLENAPLCRQQLSQFM